MTGMEQSSIFFGPFSGQDANIGLAKELFFSSNEGYSELYRYNKDGKFRILKCLKPKFRGNPIYERLLRKEYEIGNELDHVNICKVYSFVEFDGIGNCIEMEYIDGSTLQELLEEREIGADLAKKIACEVCDALSYIHYKQVLHRDLKPANILVTHNGQNVKLIDFGLADSDWHYVHKGNAGTLNYAAPELLGNGGVDNRADIWSLGKIIEEFGYKGGFAAVAKKCTNREKARRYSSADEVKRALLNGNRGKYYIVGAIVATLLIIAAGTYILWQKESSIRAVDHIFITTGKKIIEAQS